MTRRLALLTIVLAVLVIGAGYASAFLPGGAPRIASFAFAIATAALMTAISVLGVARGTTRLGALRWVFAITFLVMAGGFCAALLAPPSPNELWLGLPRGAAIILYVVGLVPLLILPVAYALTFDKHTMSDSELAELRRRLQALQQDATR
ncbi:MAG TPA: hypothetical protein VFZ04_02490 [Longimicrobiales bacterium]